MYELNSAPLALHSLTILDEDIFCNQSRPYMPGRWRTSGRGTMGLVSVWKRETRICSRSKILATGTGSVPCSAAGRSGIRSAATVEERGQGLAHTVTVSGIPWPRQGMVGAGRSTRPDWGTRALLRSAALRTTAHAMFR